MITIGLNICVVMKQKSLYKIMALHWIFIIGLVAVGAIAVSPEARIIGGASTSIEAWPSIVQVESTNTGLSWSQICAGTILNNRFVLSSAQCFSGILFSVSRRRLRGGSARRDRDGIVISVTRVFNHPDFQSSSLRADLSIVQQSALWVWAPSIQPVSIVPQGFELPDNLPVVIAGWGAIRDGGILGQTASTLQEVTLESVNNEWCAETYANTTSRVVDSNMICAGSQVSGGGGSSCGGDEGGPLYYVDSNGLTSLVGVISWTDSCSTNMPSVNTKVSAYTNWIVINAS